MSKKKKKDRPDGQTEGPAHYLDTENSWTKAGRKAKNWPTGERKLAENWPKAG